jgi:hypothetical protein
LGVRSTKSISEDIRTVEGFDVRFLAVDGEDVSLRRAEDYPYQRAARTAWTVSRWKRERFEVAYPGYRVEVLDPDGTPVHGKTLLENLRLRYAEATDSDERASYGMATGAAEDVKDEDLAGLPHGERSASKVDGGNVGSPGRRPPTPTSTGVMTMPAAAGAGGLTGRRSTPLVRSTSARVTAASSPRRQPVSARIVRMARARRS